MDLHFAYSVLTSDLLTSLLACLPQSGTGNEVDDVIRDLKKIPGFNAYAILNNDGIVIKYENMSYRTAVYHAHQVLSLSVKASKYVGDLFEHPDVCINLLVPLKYADDF